MVADAADQLSRWWAPALAFVAGLVSFASPCVFPLVPGYLSFVAGDAAVERDRSRRERLAPILLFIAGFTLVFTLEGAFAATFVRVFEGTTGQVVAGVIVVVVGLLLIGFALGRGSIGLYADRRPFLGKVRPGVAGAAPLGHGVRGRVDALHRPGPGGDPRPGRVGRWRRAGCVPCWPATRSAWGCRSC